MCFCCCDSRKSILIYMIVTTSFAFIYGIIALSQFGSSTDIYKSLINKIEKLESSGSSNANPYGRRMQYPYYGNDPYYDQAWDLLDNDSKERIEKLTTDDLNNNAYGMIKSLKGIENGLGVLLFVFIIIFLGFEIVYLVFIRGIKEFQLLPTKIYNLFNIIKIVVYALAIVFIFLGILYSFLLMGVLIQYIGFMGLDSCAGRIIVGMTFGDYCFWLFIILSCGFGKERNLFILVGSESNPGVNAQYDVNGNQIVRAIISTQPVFGVNPQIITKPPNLPYQQVPATNPYYQPQIQAQPQIQTQPQIQAQPLIQAQPPQVQIQQEIQNIPADPSSGRNLNGEQNNNVNNQ